MPAPQTVELPAWHFNFDASSSCPWRWCPTRPLPPSALPTAARLQAGCAIIFQQTAQPEHLLPAAVKSGRCFLSWQFRKMISAWGLKMPKQGQGTGKKGRLKLVDFCSVLARHFLPTFSEAELAAHIKKMAGGRGLEDNALDGNEAKLLEAVAKLDPKEGKNFQPFVDKCVDEMEKRAASAASNKRPKLDSSADARPAEAAADARPAEAAPQEPSAADVSEFPSARAKPSGEDRARPKASARRVPAPPELVELFPIIPGLYVKFLEKDRRITVEFASLAGSGFQRTKTASWPHFCGLGPKEEAVWTVLQFVDFARKVHFKEVVWTMPTREVVARQVELLVRRLAAEKGLVV